METVATRKRKTSAQVKALKAYTVAEAQEERYMGSVFVTPAGAARVRKDTQDAYDACKRLGLGVEDGL